MGMDLMSAVLISALLQADAGLTANCVPVIERDGSVLEAYRLECPDDVMDAEVLQALADAITRDLPLPYRPARSYRDRIVAPQYVRFTREPAGWTTTGSNPGYYAHPAIPYRAVRDTLSAVCVARGDVDGSGRAQNVEAACTQVTRRGLTRPDRGLFAREAVEAMEASLWIVDPDGDRCINYRYTMITSDYTMDELSEVDVPGGPSCARSR